MPKAPLRREAFSTGFGAVVEGRSCSADARLPRQQLEQGLGCRTEVAVTAVQGGDWYIAAHRRDVERHQHALPQLVAHTTPGHEGEAEARLGEALLRGQAVDLRQVGAVQAGAGELARQQMAR